MSTNSEVDDLAQRDRDVLDVTEKTDQDGPAKQKQIDRLRDRNRELEAEVQDLRDELTATKQTLFSQVNQLRDELNGMDPTDPRSGPRYEDLTLLEKYERKSPAERDDLLEPSQQRAVLIFENWADWAQTVEAGELISTNNTRGKYGKSAIKIDLEQETGDDLAGNEVYRAMKAVAKLSVQDSDDVDAITDGYGRKHVTGGVFEYHEKVNPDARGKERKFKILKLADPDGVVFP